MLGGDLKAVLFGPSTCESIVSLTCLCSSWSVSPQQPVTAIIFWVTEGEFSLFVSIILCYWYRYFLIFQQVYLERFENDGHSDSETDSDDEKPLSELKQSIVLSRYLTPSHRQLPCSDQEVTPREGLFTPQVRVTLSFYPCLSMLLLVR